MTTEQKAAHFNSLIKHLQMTYKWAIKVDPSMAGTTFDQYASSKLVGNDFARWYKHSEIAIDFDL